MPRVVSTVAVVHSDEVFIQPPHWKPPSLFCSLARAEAVALMAASALAGSRSSARAAMRRVLSAAACTQGVWSSRRRLRSSFFSSIDTRASSDGFSAHCFIAAAIAGFCSTIYLAAKAEKRRPARPVALDSLRPAIPRMALTTVHTGFWQYCRVTEASSEAFTVRVKGSLSVGLR